MPLYSRNRALLFKIETTYGTSSAPTGAADGVDCTSLEIRPLNIETVEQPRIRPYFGANPQLVAGRSVGLTVEWPMAGFGTAGPATPTAGYGALLRVCGLSQTINAGTSVVYAPVSTGFESGTAFVYQDGTLHTVLGCRGTLSASLSLRGIPVWRAELTGLYGGVTDTALVQPTLTAYQTPLPVAFGNTTLANFLGSATGICLNSLDLAFGNNVVYRNLVNCSQEVLLTNREITGSFEIEAVTVAAKDIWTLITNATLSSIDITQGTAVGNRVRLNTAVAQVSNPSFSETDGIVTISGDLRLVPTSANNELTITIT